MFIDRGFSESQYLNEIEQLENKLAAAEQRIRELAHKMSRDCKHGQLARSCNICELESEREQLARALMLLVKNDMLPADDMDIVVDAAKLAKEILGD